jgi:ArsR family transcriptional regulator
MSQPATSLCLKVLQDMDFVTATKVGKWTYYKRNDEQLFAALSELHSELDV